MTRFTLPIVVVVVVALQLKAADNEEVIPKHLADARALVKALEPADTEYKHGSGEIVWTGKVKAECDCSGLVNHLLAHSYGTTDDDLKDWFGAKRPTARRYHDTIAEGKTKQWAKVKTLNDAKPGDVIAIKYDNAEKGENTGHVMLIDAAPAEQKDTPTGIDGAEKEWHIRVIDSTSSPHGKTDTRYERGKKHTGVGSGTFRIYTGKSDDVVGYTWSTDSAKTVYRQTDHDVVIGRFQK